MGPLGPQKLPLAPRSRHRAQIGGRDDAVCHDGILAGVQAPAALHHDLLCARPGDLRPQAAQKALQVHDLRLPGGVADHRHPLGAAGRQHGVLRGPHTGDGQGHLPALEPGPLKVELAAPASHLGPQGLKGPDVQVDGPGPQGTAPGPAGHRHPLPGQQGPQKQDRGPHPAHQFVRDGVAPAAGGVHRHRAPLPAHPAAQAGEDLQGRGAVGEGRAVMYHALPVGQQCGRQNGQGAVLRPVDGHPPLQRTAAGHREILHHILSPDPGRCGFRPVYAGTGGRVRPQALVRSTRVS